MAHGVQYVLKTSEETEEIEDKKKRRARPKTLSTADELYLNIFLLRNREKKSSKDLKQDLRDASGFSVDPSTVCQNLISNGLSGRVPDKKPFLRKSDKEKRLSYANYTRTGLEINGNSSDGLRNPSLQTSVLTMCTEEVRRRVQQ